MDQNVTTDELHAALEAGEPIILVEALPPIHYRDGHLPGAVNIPHDEVGLRATDLLPDRSATIVVYCASETCANSGIAAARLRGLGYTSVHTYEAGKAAWTAAGLPLEAGVPAVAR